MVRVEIAFGITIGCISWNANKLRKKKKGGASAVKDVIKTQIVFKPCLGKTSGIKKGIKNFISY